MFFRRSSKKPGSSPGTLVYVGDRKHEKVKITVIDYDLPSAEEIDDILLNELSAKTWPRPSKPEAPSWRSVASSPCSTQ